MIELFDNIINEQYKSLVFTKSGSIICGTCYGMQVAQIRYNNAKLQVELLPTVITDHIIIDFYIDDIIGFLKSIDKNIANKSYDYVIEQTKEETNSEITRFDDKQTFVVDLYRSIWSRFIGRPINTYTVDISSGVIESLDGEERYVVKPITMIPKFLKAI